MNAPRAIRRSPGRVPGQVRAAMEYLKFALSIERGPDHYEGIKDMGRVLTREEQAARQAAVEMLRLYFAGELNFSDELVTPPDDGNDDPKVPVNVP